MEEGPAPEAELPASAREVDPEEELADIAEDQLHASTESVPLSKKFGGSGVLLQAPMQVLQNNAHFWLT